MSQLTTSLPTTMIESSANYRVESDTIGGLIIRHTNSGAEAYLQPGDDANTFRDELAGLAMVPYVRRNGVLDMMCSAYFD